MRNINKMLLGAKSRATSFLSDFIDSEAGDTNFVSMLLIIGIVVVLAGLFLTLGQNVVGQIASKVQSFISSL
ncbi:MAG: hypothetical protein ACK5LL_13230 [Suipraeoptans sp.]